MNVRIIANKYQVLAELGHGGMGRVYKVRHCSLGKIYALKIVLEHLLDDDARIGRFHNEARIMASLQHPNIVQVFDIDHDAGCPYIVLEYIEGSALDSVLKERGRLPVEQAIAIISQAGQALAYAHAHEPAVVHRDIKPANIMIENGSGRVVVADFGIAKLLDVESPRYTRTGLAIGTPRYSSPEQLCADPTLDGRSDIYSLGLVLYELLSGHPFFGRMTRSEIEHQLFHDPHELMPRFEADVPERLHRIVRRAIAKDRERRYPTVQALLDDLQAAPQSAATTAAISSASTVAIRSRRWRPARLPLSLVTLSGVALVFWPRSVEPPPPFVQGWWPEAATLILAEGRPQVFTVNATSGGAATLVYHWQIDGVPIEAAGHSWRYEPGYDDGGEHRVSVQVLDADGVIAAQAWTITVIEVNRPPQLTTIKPVQEGIALMLREGETADFAVAAMDADGSQNLSYRWLLDGATVATASFWPYRPDFAASGNHIVQVEVADPKGAVAAHRWNVTVIDVNQTPGFTSVTPAEQSVVSNTGDLAFQVGAVDPDGERLTFTWRLDGEPLDSRDDRLQLIGLADGTYALNVTVNDPEGAAVSHAWRLEIDRPQVVISPPATSAPASACDPRSTPITEADVQRWLAQYQRALEQQDTDTLAALGDVYSGQELDQLRQRQHYQPMIQDVHAVSREGTVNLRFEQIDQWYDAGSYSMVVDYATRQLTLRWQDCERIVAERN